MIRGVYLAASTISADLTERRANAGTAPLDAVSRLTEGKSKFLVGVSDVARVSYRLPYVSENYLTLASEKVRLLRWIYCSSCGRFLAYIITYYFWAVKLILFTISLAPILRDLVARMRT